MVPASEATETPIRTTHTSTPTKNLKITTRLYVKTAINSNSVKIIGSYVYFTKTNGAHEDDFAPSEE